MTPPSFAIVSDILSSITVNCPQIGKVSSATVDIIPSHKL